MKRTIVGVAVVAGLAQLAATPAQAAPRIDPVKALKAELTRGKAVNVQATAKVTYRQGMYATSGLEGTIGFDTRGAAASHVAHTLQYSEALLRNMMKERPEETEALGQGPVNMISSGQTSYVGGPVVAEALPEGTSWVRYGGTDVPSGNLLLDVLEPATLKTLMDRRASWKDGVVKGSIKTTDLAKVSSSFASRYGSASVKGRTGKISYTLWLSPNGLVERLAAKGDLHFKNSSVQVESETRYTEWGREVAILLPLEGDVIDKNQVEDDVPAEVPGIWS
ncbi:hypothetical protein [Nonomuraea sp. SYSU D8015]|uniref:hypothetical protein n=1 Tax=Nonomuraea sp. SYSU D8015 TaxID=2593644 RepID=UPI001661170A|nr:hypothetical protein [Nonomuraea sp. SYSU D8015]